VQTKLRNHENKKETRNRLEMARQLSWESVFTDTLQQTANYTESKIVTTIRIHSNWLESICLSLVESQTQRDRQTGRAGEQPRHLKNYGFLCRKIQGGCCGGHISTALADYYQHEEHQHRRVKETGVQAGQRVFPQTGRRLTWLSSHHWSVTRSDTQYITCSLAAQATSTTTRRRNRNWTK